MSTEGSRRETEGYRGEIGAVLLLAFGMLLAGVVLRTARPSLFITFKYLLLILGAAFVLFIVVLIARQFATRSFFALRVTLLIFAITGGTLSLLLHDQPLTASWHEIVFHRNLPDYRRIVLLVERGEIGSSELYDSLPPEYAHLTPGGWVVVNERPPGVYFPVVLGVVDNSEGYAYWSDSRLPPGCETFPGHCVAKAQQVMPNWFRVWFT